MSVPAGTAPEPRCDCMCDCMIPYLEGAGQHSPGCAIFKPETVCQKHQPNRYRLGDHPLAGTMDAHG